jgi:hypothetical protein
MIDRTNSTFSRDIAPPSIYAGPTSFGDYLKLALVATSLGTIGGGLGSVVESDLAVREAIYRGRAGEQAESDGDDDR